MSPWGGLTRRSNGIETWELLNWFHREATTSVLKGPQSGYEKKGRKVLSPPWLPKLWWELHSLGPPAGTWCHVPPNVTQTGNRVPGCFSLSWQSNAGHIWVLLGHSTEYGKKQVKPFTLSPVSLDLLKFLPLKRKRVNKRKWVEVTAWKFGLHIRHNWKPSFICIQGSTFPIASKLLTCFMYPATHHGTKGAYYYY